MTHLYSAALTEWPWSPTCNYDSSAKHLRGALTSTPLWSSPSLFLSLNDGSARLGSARARRAADSTVVSSPHKVETHPGLVAPAAAAAASRHRPPGAKTYTPSHHSDVTLRRPCIFIPCFKFFFFWKTLFDRLFGLFIYLFISPNAPRIFPHWLSFNKGPFVLWHFRLMLMFCNTRVASQLISTWLTVCCAQHWLPSKLDRQLNNTIIKDAAEYIFFPTWWCENDCKQEQTADMSVWIYIFLFVFYHQMVPAPQATLINYICGVSIILICDH